MTLFFVTSLQGNTALVPLPGLSTAARHDTNILEEHVIPYAPFVSETCVFMHHNARHHIAEIVQQYLQVQLPVLRCPARSPGMNSIQHVWDHLGQAKTAPASFP